MNPSQDLLTVTTEGLHCPLGDFTIDPWRPVARAVITHAHADHARSGSGSYLALADGLTVLRARLGESAVIQTVQPGEKVRMGPVTVSLHPAGHILGSAQVRVEHRGHVWVASGDYKTTPDPTCQPFEPVRCHTFITECTFGMPVYRWPDPEVVRRQILEWWHRSAAEGRVAVLLGYALGKAQRLLAGLVDGPGPIVEHGATHKLTLAYRAAGIHLPPTRAVSDGVPEGGWKGALVLAPPSAQGTPWLNRFGEISTAFASGWMMLRGTRRRGAADRGFVVSDHADWQGLLGAIEATGATTVLATHGSTAILTRYLRERGLDARALSTPWEGERADTSATADENPGEAE